MEIAPYLLPHWMWAVNVPQGRPPSSDAVTRAWALDGANAPIVLCIDDHEPSLVIRRALLESKGYRVLTAINGAMGLRLLAENAVDAIVVDYKMEGMDGLAVARIVKQRMPLVPIVLLSGYSDLPAELLGLVDAFVKKGQAATVLVEELKRVIRMARSEHPLKSVWRE